MANTGLPSNLFSGGAVTFNTQPSVQFYAQLMQRQQAKRDALDQYYTKTLSDVTPAGMRNKDVIGGWTKKLNDWQDFGMNPQNRTFLLNPRLDNYQTVTKFNQMHQDLLNDAEMSKQEAKDDLLLYQLKNNAKRALTGLEDKTSSSGFTPGSDMDIMFRKSLSIYDPRRKDIYGNEPDKNQLSANQPEFTPLNEKQLYQSAFSNIKPNNKIPDNSKQYKKEGYIYTPFTKKFTNDQIKNGAEIYAANLDKPALTHYEQLMHEADIYNAATDAYQTIYGKNQLIDTPQKMAKGIAVIHALGQSESGEDKITDLALAQQRKQSNIRLAHILSGNDPNTINANIDSIIQADMENANNNDGVVPTTQAKFKALTGQNYNPKTDVLKIDNNGNYTYFKKQRNPDTGEITETLTKVSDIPNQEAKTSLIKNWKTGLSGDYNTGNKTPSIYKPKVIKHTKSGAPIIGQ